MALQGAWYLGLAALEMLDGPSGPAQARWPGIICYTGDMPYNISPGLLAAQNKTLTRQYVLWYLANHPCIDCGEDDIVVLEFDHQPEEEKSFSLAMAISGRESPTLEEVVDEVAKCDVRCANCHRYITCLRSGSWRTRVTPKKLAELRGQITFSE